uniref:V-type proton ATPase subunit a n=1 Tax=Caenorhabditis tropicalis TaxID=1561998 RepID=A0A1I7TKG1_9PELO
MESELSGISNESQIAWFGFSAISFSDSVFNVYVDTWEEVCSEEFKSSLKKLTDKDRLALLSFPFIDKSIEKVFKLMKRYCVTEIFHIPVTVTLPECKKMLLASNKEAKSQSKAEKDFSMKLEKIRSLRIKLVQRKNEIESINGAIEVLHVMEKSQEQLIQHSKTVPKSPSRMASPV